MPILCLQRLAHIYDAAFPFVQCLFPLWNFLKYRLKCELCITPLLLRSSEAFRHKHLKIKDFLFPLLILSPTVNGVFAWLRISGCIRIQRETTVKKKKNSHQCFLSDHERHITECINKYCLCADLPLVIVAPYFLVYGITEKVKERDLS